MKELTEWGKWYNKIYKDAPKLQFEKAEKGIFNDHFYVRIPLVYGGGMIYFTKNKSLEAVFIRNNLEDGSKLDSMTGFRDFINLNTFQLTRITYEKGKQIKINCSQQRINSNNQGSSDIRIQTTWFEQLLNCLAAYLGVPARGADGDWTECWTLFGSNESGGDPITLTYYIPDFGSGNVTLTGYPPQYLDGFIMIVVHIMDQ